MTGSKQYWGIDDVRVSYLTNGDKVNLNTFEMFPAQFKKSLLGREHQGHERNLPSYMNI
jgi:hypothetical protein